MELNALLTYIDDITLLKGKTISDVFSVNDETQTVLVFTDKSFIQLHTEELNKFDDFLPSELVLDTPVLTLKERFNIGDISETDFNAALDEQRRCTLERKTRRELRKTREEKELYLKLREKYGDISDDEG